MNIFDELYYETHEDTLKQEYYDYLQEFNLTKEEFSFIDFLDTF